MNVCIHLASGFEEIEAISIIDVLRRANIQVTVVSTTGALKVEGGHKVTIIADDLFENIDYDMVSMIVLPGGMPGTLNLNNHEGLKNCILDFNSKNKYIAAICAAPLVLGNLGLLHGKTATCFPGFEKQLSGATISKLPVVVDDNIITGKGAGVALHFALKIVEVLIDKLTANKLSQQLQLP